MATVHIVGAGVAGLAAATALAERGRAVALHEAAGHAGGRCRSFHDDTVGRVIDNGNHLLLSGNRAAMGYLRRIGARDALFSPPRPAFAFVDLPSGRRWTLRPNRGRLPWWIFVPARRAPDSGPGDYLAGLRFARAGSADTVADIVDRARPAYRRFWEPLAVAVLNAAADEAAATLLWPVLRETFGRGGAACRPCIAREGLSAAFVDPALAFLAARGVRPCFARRLRAVKREDGRVERLVFTDETVTLAAGDAAILALPPLATAELLPGTPAPAASRAIVNAHFRLPDAAATVGGAALGGDLPFLGLIGGTAHWLFRRGDVVSVTVSAADALAEEPAEALAATLWADVARAMDLAPSPPPPCRVVKEKRATFAQIPAELARRAGTRTACANLFLAGDWTDTRLPATIEGAIRSGEAAARAALGRA